MKAGFVIGLGLCLMASPVKSYGPAQVGNHMAGFNSQWVRNYEPAKEDGISRVGEPDWEASETVEAAEVQTDAGSAETEPAVPAEAPESTETKKEEGDEAGQEPDEEADGEWISLGDDWVITYYCPLECCNDQWAWQTSTQAPMQLHHTIAVDPSVIPYYSHVRIGGLDYEYVAEDCGGGIKGKRIDVLVANCTIANEMGVDRNVEVWVQK